MTAIDYQTASIWLDEHCPVFTPSETLTSNVFTIDMNKSGTYFEHAISPREAELDLALTGTLITLKQICNIVPDYDTSEAIKKEIAILEDLLYRKEREEV